MKRAAAKRLLELCKKRPTIAPNSPPDVICETLADILTSANQETRGLMLCVESRLNRRMFPKGDRTPMYGLIDRWLTSMKEYSAATITAKADLQDSISARIRAAHRERLAMMLTEFVNGGTPEEIRLMLSILETRDGIGGFSASGVIPLAHAFSLELDENNTYVAVPEELVKEVIDFIKWHSSIEKVEAINGRPC